MKKIVAMMLALAMVLAMTSALAAIDSNYPKNIEVNDKREIQFIKNYTINGVDNPTDAHPADAFKFKVADKKYYVAGKVASLPTDKTIPDITFSKVEPTEEVFDDNKYAVKFNLPDFSGLPVGEYVYQLIEETPDGKTAGVTYYDTDTNKLYLKITLVNELGANDVPTGKILIGGIALRAGDPEVGDGPYGEKLSNADGSSTGVHNNYNKGSLTVEKKVTGNLADTGKPWIFKVQFTPAASETIRSTIAVNDSSTGTFCGKNEPSANAAGEVAFTEDSTKVIAVADATKEIYFLLTDGQKMIFDNIPENVTYVITEVESGKYGYDEAVETYSDSAKKISKGDADTATFTNKKDLTPDTGIELEAVPYIMIMAIALMGVAMMFVRRREEM